MSRRSKYARRSAAGGRSLRVAGGALAGLVVLTASPLALGDSEPLGPLAVTTQIDSSFCSDVAAVERETTGRSPRIRFVASNVGERRVNVTGLTSRTRGGVGAAVRLSSKEMLRERELWADSCADLVRAVGFLISVTFDPPAPSVEGVSAEPPQRPQEAPGVDPPDLPVKPGDPAGGGRSSREADWEVSPIAGRPEVQVRLGLGGTGTWGVAPSALLGAGVFFQSDWHQPGAALGGMFRFEVAADTSVTESFDGGVAQFRRLSAGLLGGPSWRLGEPSVRIAPALLARVGLLDARGRDTVNPQAYQRPWFELGGAVLVAIELAKGWFVEFEIAATSPVTRYAFQFDPIVFHHVSPFLTHVGIYTSASF